MSELKAEPLSPIDAATLWPQLGRLDAEIIAPRQGESLLISSGLAATGLGRLPRLPNTMVLGIRRGLKYRGVLVTRQLAGSGWEVVSARLARTGDSDAAMALLNSCSQEVIGREGRIVFLRFPEDSCHRDDFRRSGFQPYAREQLFRLPQRPNDGSEWVFRPAARADRAGIFRLYCRVVPEHVRRNEAVTQQDWRSVHASYDCERELVLEQDGSIVGWIGYGGRESHILLESGIDGAADAALDLVEQSCGGDGHLVLQEHQVELLRAADERQYSLSGGRLVSSRRLALVQTLKEVVAVPADSAPVPH